MNSLPKMTLVGGETGLKQRTKLFKQMEYFFFVHPSSQNFPYLFLPTIFSAKDNILQIWKALMNEV